MTLKIPPISIKFSFLSFIPFVVFIFYFKDESFSLLYKTLIMLYVYLLFVFCLITSKIATFYMFKKFNYKTEQVVLSDLCDKTYNKINSPYEKFMISICGPFISLLLTPLFMTLPIIFLDNNLSTFLKLSLILIALINPMIVFINMFPVFPLNGYHILHSILWKIIGKQYRSELFSIIIGYLFFIGFCVFMSFWFNITIVVAGIGLLVFTFPYDDIKRIYTLCKEENSINLKNTVRTSIENLKLPDYEHLKISK